MASKSTLTQLDPQSANYRKWLLTPGFRKPTASVMHHTASPTAAQYRGRNTISAIRSYHVGKGWSDIAAQGYACPDGTVFTARPMDVQNFCHAYIVRNNPLGNLADYWHQDRQYLNCTAPAFGLETVANFSLEDPESGLGAKSLECAFRVLAVVHKTFSIPAEKCFFHRQAEEKDCPGARLNLDEFRQELARRIGAVADKEPNVADKEPKVVGPDNQVIDCAPQMVGGEMTVAAGKLLVALGVPPVPVADVPAGVIHANGRAYVGELGPYCPGYVLVLKHPAQGWRLYCKRVS